MILMTEAIAKGNIDDWGGVLAKVKFFSSGARNKAYHVRVDPLPSRYDKADEAALKILGATLKKELGVALVDLTLPDKLE